MSARDALDELGTALRAQCRHLHLDPCTRASASEVAAWNLANADVRLIGAPLRRCAQCGVVTWAGSVDDGDVAARAIEGLALLGTRGMTVSWRAKDSKTESAPSDTPSTRTRTPRFTLRDVILPASTRLELDEALVKVRFHHTIYESWGFGAVDPAGRGVSLNLHGPPGTGKTRAAEAIAGELGRPLLQLTAGDLESRYMGETSKNIQSVFREAGGSETVLFFDEADSLFGRRASEVTQGVDHEVNVAKSTLLVELDRFEGVLVLATNFPQNFDRAFVRRVSHHVAFCLPDSEARRAIWGLHLVPSIPLAVPREVLLDTLVEESEGLSGGDVLTALRLALPAALLAGGDDPRVTAEHLVGAIGRVRRAKVQVATGSRRATPEQLSGFFGGAPRPHTLVANGTIPDVPHGTNGPTEEA